jgi:hypothetical protein
MLPLDQATACKRAAESIVVVVVKNDIIRHGISSRIALSVH